MKEKRFKRERSNFHSDIEVAIENEFREMPTISLEKEPPILNQSSYIFRPDFRLGTTDKSFIIESKAKISPNDVAMVSGSYVGLPAQPIIITQDEPDSNTSRLANRLNITVISGSPSEAVRKLKEIVVSREEENEW